MLLTLCTKVQKINAVLSDCMLCNKLVLLKQQKGAVAGESCSNWCTEVLQNGGQCGFTVYQAAVLKQSCAFTATQITKYLEKSYQFASWRNIIYCALMRQLNHLRMCWITSCTPLSHKVIKKSIETSFFICDIF